MPTLHRRTGSTLHPKQTDYYIVAHPPEISYITYQIDSRGRDFLIETLEYGDDDDLSWSLVHALRQIGDLFTLDEGGPQHADPTESKEGNTPQLTGTQVALLIEYLTSHPDVTGDLSTLERRLRAGKATYLDSIKRDGYTPTRMPGHSGGTGNKALDRIASKYFDADSRKATIEWNGEHITDFITVEDRNGEVYHFPNISRRIPEAEQYRLSKDLYERWGAEIGASDVISRRYDPDEEGFPNRWIGQREDAPEPSLDDALSPRAFFYRTLAGRGGYAPGTQAKEAFEAASDYSLEVYKANFPRAVDPQTLSTKYATIEKATKPWNDFQVPPQWIEEYDDGLPPLIR